MTLLFLTLFAFDALCFWCLMLLMPYAFDALRFDALCFYTFCFWHCIIMTLLTLYTNNVLHFWQLNYWHFILLILYTNNVLQKLNRRIKKSVSEAKCVKAKCFKNKSIRTKMCQVTKVSEEKSVNCKRHQFKKASKIKASEAKCVEK